MKPLLFTSSFLVTVALWIQPIIGIPGDPLHSDDPYSGSLGSMHSLYSPSRQLGNYDDMHKYGGIGKKAQTSSLYDHGSKGYKNYYGDSGYGNQGLNKYTNQLQADQYGSKSGNHANFHDGHVYTRNRGYGYEKRYAFDKEFSTSKHGGTQNGHHSVYGDHKKMGKSAIQAHKNYENKKYGAKNAHNDRAYGKHLQIVNNHNEQLLKKNDGIQKLIGHPTGYYSDAYGSPEYIPVIEHYGGALGHGTSASYGHGSDFNDHDGLLDYDSPNNMHSSASVVYIPSASDSATSALQSDNRTGVSSKINADNKATNALISTKLSPTPSTYGTIGDHNGVRVNSAVHATPAVISTNNGVHYYNS